MAQQGGIYRPGNATPFNSESSAFDINIPEAKSQQVAVEKKLGVMPSILHSVRKRVGS
jgi:hypothetical protein